MSPFMVLVLLVVVAAVAGLGYGAGLVQGSKSRHVLRKENAALKKSLKGLRAIANGAGSPALEAQLALDELERDLA